VSIYEQALQIPDDRLKEPRKEQLMLFIGMIIVGFIVGAVAKLILMPGRDPGGVIMTILLGSASSVLAGFIGRSVGWYAGNKPAGWIASVIIATLILAVYQSVVGRRVGRSSSKQPGCKQLIAWAGRPRREDEQALE
jgi:uncharacterized membrane protein YeaQ/YmgE (transglycosylase-associated protein family)